MKRIRKQKWLRYTLSALAVSVLLTVYMIMTVEGEGRVPKFAMMRLEDIGPGGQYGSLEQLGKLRAVLEYLQDEQANYHLAVIPRWIDIPKDGPRYDVRLDDPDNPYAASFRRVLHEAVDGGATLGMHGYTHQVGDVRRDDGHQESGIGNEFNVDGLKETKKAEFAERRVKEGLAIFTNIGLKPQFWEAPHYHTTAEQDRMFRSYFGLHYQADVQANRNAPAAQYAGGRNNGYGASTLGAAYVPTPLDYIPSNKDEKMILDRMGKTGMVTSFFFHPFLEFKYMEKVTDSDGEPVLRDGIPEYRYASSGKSLLHKLVAGLKAKGYAFYSIQDYVPFTPANSIKLPAVSGGAREKGYPLLGDANGDGQLDMIHLDAKSGVIYVTEGRYRGLRNEESPVPTEWGRIDYVKGSAAAVSGRDDTGPCTLWMANASGKLERYASDGSRFVKSGSWKIDASRWSRLYMLRQPNGDMVVAGLSLDKLELYGWRIRQGEVQPLKPYRFRNALKSELQPRQDGTIFIARNRASSGIQLRPDPVSLEWSFGRTDTGLPNEAGLLKFGDYNGDGLEDAIRFDPATMRYTVYLRGGEGQWRQISTFGPWGQPGADAELAIADFDGNGKSDLGLTNHKDGYLDTALSFVHLK
ncbi:DUF2334 domain-containing protein [Paenibacillus allorhizosphaerae]|uniref:DUF2334 domain-containing protein n=1 Tax=Paenibacillus allorhizosphaerae TaxID=2849866 RepID=A0ABM8VEQ4_9BACL|nr:DUF2334 domain-containing protein [Paenibacillus allorhizosphaerae]CAG7632098.1 hypothetical protein PAECIP111802_01812 [Paenibacillus allorhizosphaerae]